MSKWKKEKKKRKRGTIFQGQTCVWKKGCFPACGCALLSSFCMRATGHIAVIRRLQSRPECHNFTGLTMRNFWQSPQDCLWPDTLFQFRMDHRLVPVARLCRYSNIYTRRARRTGCFPWRLESLSFISRWKNVLAVFAGCVFLDRVSSFCRHMGQIFLVTSACMAWCRHGPQNMWPGEDIISKSAHRVLPAVRATYRSA